MIRRNLAIGLVLLAGASLFAAQSRSRTTVVRTDNGLISGKTDSHGVTAYLGIPYAAPPVGNLRWRPPQPAAPWKGLRQADHFSPGCIQNEMGVRLPWTRAYMTQGPISEDCLYLNVWTSSPNTQKKEPVMFWIHGGGLREGSSKVAIYDGANLARKGVLLVSINYRLGPLGFLAYPPLTAESKNHSSGNYGLLDQIAALKWVHRNIAAFGGDPSNVTIFGQSAGARSTYVLIQSPLAKGLFAHAITQSGEGATPGMPSPKPLSVTEKEGVKLVQSLGVHSLKELRALPASAFVSSAHFGFSIDNWAVPAKPPAHAVPLVNGMVATDIDMGVHYGEGTPPVPVTMRSYEATMKQICGDQLATCLKLYPAHKDQEANSAFLTALRDRSRVSIYLWGLKQSQRSSLYTYFFDHPQPWSQHPQFGAFHTSEVPYIFETLSVSDRPWKPIDLKIANEMSSYWTNFAKTGNPNGPGLAHWPEFDANSRTTMELGSHMGPILLASSPAKLNFWLDHLRQ